jgi:polysaccharide biosynthesis/export protein
MSTAHAVGRVVVSVSWLVAAVTAASAQQAPKTAPSAARTAESPIADTATATAAVPADYVIGPDDQLSVVFFQNRDMSADVVVRPDGKISLPLVNDVVASGLTPEQLRERVTGQAKRFVQDPQATIVVKQINSRKVFIIGSVEKPGTYPLTGPTTVLQLIATAAGIKEYADSRKIVVLRNEAGRSATIPFNYKDVIAQKNLEQNILLRPGDTVIVP